MKRFHVNVAVADLQKSVDFYQTLFGQPPTVLKDDYVKWMLDDPRINFSLSPSTKSRGVNHVGLQADTLEELGDIQQRLYAAGESTYEQPDAECCYAHSSKTWVRDPDAVVWETFVTHDDITYYGEDTVPEQTESQSSGSSCCA